MNGHAKSRLTLETTADTPVRTKGQAGACPDRRRAIPCKVRAVTAEVSMIWNMRGMILAIRGMLRCCPWRAGQLAKAIRVLQTREA